MSFPTLPRLLLAAVTLAPALAAAQTTIVVPPQQQAQPADPYGYNQPQPPPAQPQYPYNPNQPQYPAQNTYPPTTGPYGQPQAQQPAQPYAPYQPAQPAQPAQPYYQQPAATPPPAAQPAPAPRYSETGAYTDDTQKRVAKAKTVEDPNGKTLTDRLQERGIYHAKRAAVMSVPSGLALAAGVLVGSIVGGVGGIAIVGAGAGSGAINNEFLPTFLLLSLPAIPFGGLVVGLLAYTVARIATVISVSLFYPGEAKDFDERIRNMRVYLVADTLGHVGGALVAFAALGLLSVVGGLVSSIIGLLSVSVLVQTNTDTGGNFWDWDYGARIPISVALFLFGATSLSIIPLALILSVATSHAGFPLATLFTRAFIFNDPDTE